MKTVKINLYTLAELNPDAKYNAISEVLNFLDNELVEYKTESGEMKSEYFDHTEEEAEDFIKVNEYLFFANGEQASIITYCGAHPRAGESELKFFGETFKL